MVLFGNIKYKTMKEKDTTYANCMKIWNDFFIFHNKFEPEINGITGKNLNYLINYFKKKHPLHSPESCFSAMFNNWHLLPEVYQQQTEMRQIYSNINIILIQIKSKYVRPERKIPTHWQVGIGTTTDNNHE